MSVPDGAAADTVHFIIFMLSLAQGGTTLLKLSLSQKEPILQEYFVRTIVLLASFVFRPW